MPIVLATLTGRFLMYNRAICDRVEEHLADHFIRSLLKEHLLATVAEIARRAPDAWVVDIGGGQASPFADNLRTDDRPAVIGFDIDKSLISANQSIDCGIAGDACRG